MATGCGTLSNADGTEHNIANPMSRTDQPKSADVDLFCSATCVEVENRASVVRSEEWKPYSAYKPSGVEWLGEIPAPREVKRLKRRRAPQIWTPSQVADWIHRAFVRRQGVSPYKARRSFGRNWTRHKYSGGWTT